MDIAAPTPEPSASSVRRDRSRVGYALLGAFSLVAGIWLAWFGAWAMGWSMDDLGIRPRDSGGLVGVLTAPFAHASFEHLMSNTLPLGMLAALALYAYPRATRFALPFIWLFSGLGVWLWARPSVHVGISGIVVGLMTFLFLTGLLRRDRLGVAIALLVFFLYGGMLMSTLPHDPKVSFEYHLFGALAGTVSAIAFFRFDPLPPRRRYSWEEDEEAGDSMSSDRDELEPASPRDVPVLWEGPNRPRETGGDNIVAFPAHRPRGTTLH